MRIWLSPRATSAIRCALSRGCFFVVALVVVAVVMEKQMRLKSNSKIYVHVFALYINGSVNESVNVQD